MQEVCCMFLRHNNGKKIEQSWFFFRLFCIFVLSSTVWPKMSKSRPQMEKILGSLCLNLAQRALVKRSTPTSAEYFWNHLRSIRNFPQQASLAVSLSLKNKSLMLSRCLTEEIFRPPRLLDRWVSRSQSLYIDLFELKLSLCQKQFLNFIKKKWIESM